MASDIYSLGVLLYELLADVAPYRLRRSSERSYLDQLRDVIGSPGPARWPPPRRGSCSPATWTLVVQKAMRLAPEERYPTATAFADELTRFLTGHPVQARPDSLGYRTRKFVLRHRAASAAAVAILAAVTAGTSASLWQARAGRDRAAPGGGGEGATSPSIFQEASPYGADGRSLSVVQLLQRAHADLERIGEQKPELRVELLNLLGSALLELGETDAGERMSRQALRESAALPAGAPAAAPGPAAQLRRPAGARAAVPSFERSSSGSIPELRATHRSAAGGSASGRWRSAPSWESIEVRRDDAIADAREALDLARKPVRGQGLRGPCPSRCCWPRRTSMAIGTRSSRSPRRSEACASLRRPTRTAQTSAGHLRTRRLWPCPVPRRPPRPELRGDDSRPG